MRSYLFLVVFVITNVSIANSQELNKTKSNTTNSKKSVVVNTKQSTLPTTNTKKTVTPKAGFEGVTISSTATSYTIDTLIKKNSGTIDKQYLGGIWFYLKTSSIGKDKNLTTIVRAYFNDLDQELYNSKKETKQVNLLSDDQMMSDAVNFNKIEAEKLGRPTLEPTESLIVFDPNVQYLIFDKDGENEDILSIRKQTPSNEIMVLTTSDIRVNIKANPKNNNIYYIIKDFNSGVEKEFLLLELSESKMTLCDLKYNEVHFFDKSGIHTK
jgi:hypothetical protein